MTEVKYKVGDIVEVRDVDYDYHGPVVIENLCGLWYDCKVLPGCTRKDGSRTNMNKHKMFSEDEIVGYYMEPPKKEEKTEAQKRKGQPIVTGCILYFPDALLLVAEHSLAGNQQHHPGKPLHWEYGKSMDHEDCEVRHLIDAASEPTYEERLVHKKAKAWRALADLQTFVEDNDPELHKKRQAMRERAAKGER